MSKVTYPPEMLPSPAEGDEADIIVIDPDTGRAEIVMFEEPSIFGFGLQGRPLKATWLPAPTPPTKH